ncbi:hypothetical protein BGP_4039 [Beggiatoa sp. PS]|nr:hypothetical protein BGP_4039 [Beggiatoa sp. PS]
MYTNALLEEKYKAQRQLSKKAKAEKVDYFEIVNMEVQNLFKHNGWDIQFDKRNGGNLGDVLRVKLSNLVYI